MGEKKTCFVIQGFGKKTDYRTGRTLGDHNPVCRTCQAVLQSA